MTSTILRDEPAATSTQQRVAAVYCRVSTTDQKDEGTSLDTQRDACLAHAQQLGYDVPPELIFLEDWPGTTLDRPLLDQLRKLVRERTTSAVIVYVADRLSRGDPY